MKKIGIIFFITFILASCNDNNINNDNKITIDSDTINMSEVEKQPNF